MIKKILIIVGIVLIVAGLVLPVLPTLATIGVDTTAPHAMAGPVPGGSQTTPSEYDCAQGIESQFWVRLLDENSGFDDESCCRLLITQNEDTVYNTSTDGWTSVNWMPHEGLFILNLTDIWPQYINGDIVNIPPGTYKCIWTWHDVAGNQDGMTTYVVFSSDYREGAWSINGYEPDQLPAWFTTSDITFRWNGRDESRDVDEVEVTITPGDGHTLVDLGDGIHEKTIHLDDGTYIIQGTVYLEDGDDYTTLSITMGIGGQPGDYPFGIYSYILIILGIICFVAVKFV